MLVYANHLTIEGIGASDTVLRAIGGWLKEQLGFGLHPEKVICSGAYKGNRGDVSSWLRIFAASSDTPQLYAWVLKIGDSDVRGRQWITELGLRVSEQNTELSCLVKTDDFSTLVAQSAMASQPRVIRYVFENVNESSSVNFASSVPGLRLKTVGATKDSYRGLLAEIEHEARESCLVVVSPDAEGVYSVDPLQLQKRVFGLAQVIKVSKKFNSFEMSAILGQRWSAWGGAVNLIPTRNKSGAIPTSLFLSDAIKSWGNSEHDRVSRLLAAVTDKTNIPRLRKRIRPEGVAQMAVRQYLRDLHTRAAEMTAAEFQEKFVLLTQELQERNELLEESFSETDTQQATIEDLAASRDEAEEELRKTEYQVDALKIQLQNLGETRGATVDYEFLVDLARSNDQPCPVDCLRVIQQLYGDKCTVLPNAWESASEMNLFSRGRRLLDLLIRLVTDYREALLDGGDSKARQCFSRNEFAAAESETVMSNRDLAQARTFDYEGNSVPMFRHLKIGKADNQRKTIRVHFHWDADKQKIVLGHCGAHLPISGS